MTIFMAKNLRLYSCLAAIFFFQTFQFQLGAQTFTASLESYNSAILNQHFTTYEVFGLDVHSLDAFVTSNAESPVQLNISAHKWQLDLIHNPIVSEDYSLRFSTPQGIVSTQSKRNIAYKGYELNTGGKVRLTLHGSFLYGYIDAGNERYYIEPLWYFEPEADRDLFVLYQRSSVAPFPPDACGVTEEFLELQHLEDAADDKAKALGSENSACYAVEIAIASDESMLSKYGSVSGVEDHNIGVLNNVEGDYTGNFDHDLSFVIVTQFVSDDDPWTNSTDAGTLLGSFRTWGNNGNFGVGFDVGELWTNRNFDGSTIGIAYLNGICNSNKYHCLQDFSGNAEFLRVLTSHELGHNFSSGHDAGCPPPNYIMCPSVSSATEWSSQSTDVINSYIQSKINSGCLTECGPPPPPLVAAFDWTPNPGCEDQPITFTDLSTGNINNWSWTFPGGSPSSSSQQNPSVTWSTPGTKNVTLTITGVGGSNAITQSIEIQSLPEANFNYSVNGLEVSFTNNSINATSYEWDFGDGIYSQEENPVHEYQDAGTYIVLLKAFNDCGFSTRSTVINTAPTASFVANPKTGCAALTVQMENQSSSNAISFVWTLPGGIPATTNQPNPSVIYNTPGTYTVTLRATNGSGSDTLVRVDYITVKTSPTANFTSSINGPTVTFTNTSVGNPSTYHWSFGDGDTSILANPVHTYANPGTYTVTLTATNECGSSTKTQEVVILSSVPPTAAFTANPSTGCVPQTVSFTNNSTGASSYSWSFPGGTPTSSTETNPVVLYDSVGTYTVTLTASNSNGSSTATSTVTINTTPVPGFTHAVSNDTTVNFTNTTVGGTEFLWIFGDGDSSVVANPVHDYASLDSIITYRVILFATNACGTLSDTQMVTIVTAPIANFSANPGTGCAPLTVQFVNASSPNALDYNWQFPGGNPASSAAQNPPVVVYDVPGTYTATLTVSNSAGSSSFTQTILVSGAPSANFNATVSGLLATFINSSTNGTAYSWDFGDNTSSNEVNPTHYYAVDGTYTVVLTASNDCGTNSFTQNVVIITEPDAGFSVNTTSGCAVLSVNFTDISSGDPVSWAWDFPGGSPASSTEQNPTVQYFTPGVYDVTLVVTSAGGSTSSFSQPNFITVNGAPIPGFSAIQNAANVSFLNTTTGASSYLWNFGDGSNSAETEPTHTYASDGTYNITLSATNNCGTAIFEQTITVASPPTAGFNLNNEAGCAPLTVQFINTSSSNTTALQWDFPGGNPASSTDENPMVTWNTPGIYTVTLTASNAAGSSTSTATITVQAAPTAGFSYTVSQTTVNFTSSTQNATSFAWNFGDNNSSTSENPTHTYGAPGSYNVSLSATNNCGTTIYEQTIVLTSGTNDAPWVEGFRLFPNPNTGVFSVEMTGLPQDEVEFTLFNTLGQQIKQDVVNFETGSLLRAFDYGNLPAGFYTLRIQASGQEMFVKVTIGK